MDKPWTPRPWMVEPGSDMPKILGGGADGEDVVAELYGTEQEIHVNAHLIAAAPDLVEALEILEPLIQRMADMDSAYWGPKYEMVFKALTKAYGEDKR